MPSTSNREESAFPPESVFDSDRGLELDFLSETCFIFLNELYDKHFKLNHGRRGFKTGFFVSSRKCGSSHGFKFEIIL
ncbi:hypothetical protein BV917_14620 [Leptospira santarosai serovar Guaricura]|nr:hypothetical protein BV917_14620 [Leptospira santarosai serovar Guaricura]